MKNQLMENLKTRNSQGNSSMCSEEMSDRRKPGAVYIDCSNTFHTGLKTGIQRVVRNITCRSNYLSSTFNVPCIPVVFSFGRVWTFDDLSANKSLKLFDIRQGIDRVMRSLFNSLAVPVKLIIPEGKFRSGLRRICYVFYSLVKSFCQLGQFALVFCLKRPKPVSISRDDLLIAADSFWSHSVVDYLEDFSRHGVSVVSVIYDLIPITHPEYVNENFVKTFNAHIDRLLSVSDGVIGISKSTRGDIMNYIERKNNQAYKNMVVDYFYLGADIEREGREKKKANNIRAWPDGLWERGEVYLMVGTIEPRKGYDIVLNAFEKMWSEGSDARLLIVGRIGWKCSDLMEQLNNSPYRDSRLFVFHDINDDELIYCYSQAFALIFASRIEGFGLPLVEAMGKGLPVVASDIPIFKEIGGDYPVYFSLDSVDSLIESLRSVSKTKPERRGWMSWDESVVSLMEKALSIYAGKMKAQDSPTDWARFYSMEITNEFMTANIAHHRFLVDLITEFSDRAQGRKLVEVGIGTATMSIYFSQSSFDVTGVDNNPHIVKKAVESNKQLDGRAEFVCMDAMDMPEFFKHKNFDVAFSQGMMEHFDNGEIKRLIEAQLYIAKYVVFSVPSINWPQKDFGDERLMTLEEWERILSDCGFKVERISYYQKDNLHIAAVLSEYRKAIQRGEM